MVAIGALLLPIAAQAAPPTLNAAGQVSRHITAEWTLPPGMATDFIEAATKPDVYPPGHAYAGEFLDENKVFLQFLPDGATSYFSTAQYPAGTYYVHVAAYDPVVCAQLPPPPECIDEFSGILEVILPPDPPPAPPPPPPSPPPPPPPDTVTTFSALTAPSKQKVEQLYVQAAMNEGGTLTAGGTVSVPGAAKVFKFKSVTVTAVAGVSVKLKLKLAKKALKAVKKALKRKKKLKAKLTIIAKDLAGNTTTQKRTITLKL